MKPRAAGVTAIVWACAAAIPAVATEVRAASASIAVTRQLIEQKEALVKRLLADSPALQRVQASGNSEAQKQLEAAQKAYGKALIALENNDLHGADTQLNGATLLIGKARQLVSDSATRNVAQRVRYARILESVESLRLTYQRHLQRVRRDAADTATNDERLISTSRQIDIAKHHAGAQRFAQANQTLSGAENELMLSIMSVLGVRTVEYALRFESEVEEYGFELDRNRSYAELIPIALAEFKPASKTIRQVNYFLEINWQMRELAQRYAAAKNFKEALAAVRGGTSYLQNALAAAGLNVPQEPKLDTIGRP